MNHFNLKFIVDSRLNHPYGVLRRLQFFASQANKKLVFLSGVSKDHKKVYTVV